MNDNVKGAGCLILILLFIMGMIKACVDENAKKQALEEAIREYRANPPKPLEWWEGGTLNQKKVSDWVVASDRDKLATCGGWVLVWIGKGWTTEPREVLEKDDQHRKTAMALKTGIDIAVLDVRGDGDITTIAVLVATALKIINLPE